MRAFKLYTPIDICAALGVRVRRLRLLKNLSQQQLAEMTATSLSSIRRLESHGRGSVELLVSVAQALHVAEQWESLFAAPIESIADAERAARPQRQRARVVAKASVAKK